MGLFDVFVGKRSSSESNPFELPENGDQLGTRFTQYIKTANEMIEEKDWNADQIKVEIVRLLGELKTGESTYLKTQLSSVINEMRSSGLLAPTETEYLNNMLTHEFHESNRYWILALVTLLSDLKKERTNVVKLKK